MFQNLIRMFCDEIKPQTEQKQEKKEAVNNTAELKLTDKVRFKADIQAIEKELGALMKGKEYKLTLTRALEIMPRDRKRVDAYDTLVKYLSERGVTLIVESRKTKKNESKKN